MPATPFAGSAADRPAATIAQCLRFELISAPTATSAARVSVTIAGDLLGVRGRHLEKHHQLTERAALAVSIDLMAVKPGLSREHRTGKTRAHIVGLRTRIVRRHNRVWRFGHLMRRHNARYDRT